jgi:hypothetical protein
VTGEDHNTDALVAALRSPALPAEQVGEAAAVAAMYEAQTLIPAASRPPRSRRGVAVAAVTVASLGLGGLVAAGPGIFSPAADRPDNSSMARTTVSEERAVDAGEPGGAETTSDATQAGGAVGRITDDPDVECVAGGHGRTVSSVANAAESDSEAVTGAAHSECGMPDRDPDDTASDEIASDEQAADEQTAEDPDIECTAGNHGKTVSSVAQATESGPGKGATVSEAARSGCGDTDENAPGASDDNPGNSDRAPGQSGDNPGNSDQAPGHTGDNPGNSDQAPGHTGDTPGNSDQAPGHTGDTPGKSDDTPGKSDEAPGQGDAPGQSGEAPGNSGKNKP